VNRRDFLKLSGSGVGAALALGLTANGTAEAAPRQFPLEKGVKEAATVCCYCSVGCGAIVTTYQDGTIKIQGDPDHPVSLGALCPKGQAMAQIHQVNGKTNPRRLTKPLYRAPGSTAWEEKPWDWMVDAIAQRVKATRDSTWNMGAGRTDAIASLGGGELDNEECYLLSKMDRALGLVYMEHCARL
jgi:anaerobic selenocysteine-containing dehydrogenase